MLLGVLGLEQVAEKELLDRLGFFRGYWWFFFLGVGGWLRRWFCWWAVSASCCCRWLV